MPDYREFETSVDLPTVLQGAIMKTPDVDPAVWDAQIEASREAHRLARAAVVRREIAEQQAREAAGRLPPGRRKRSNGASSVFALRLGHDERTALEARADLLGLAPSVLARNYIRMALTRADARTQEILDRIDAQLVELRASLPR